MWKKLGYFNIDTYSTKLFGLGQKKFNETNPIISKNQTTFTFAGQQNSVARKQSKTIDEGIF